MPTPIPPSRPLPALPNLEFDRRQAKLLLKDARRADPAALERFRVCHPRFPQAADPSALALHDAQLVIAREYGFPSWPRWKQFVELRQMDRSARATELVKAACSGNLRKARLLLQSEPDLASADLASACASGDFATAERLLALYPERANAPVGPLCVPPLLYVCFSRLLRALPGQRDAFHRIARLLLALGADPNAFFWHDSDGERWLQSALYGAAGIANDAPLTALLLDAGARLHPEDKESLYHATEFPDPACLRLLLERGQPPLEQVRYCLGRATDFEYPVHVSLFLAAGADPNDRVRWDGLRTHLHKAVYLMRSVEIVRLLIEAGADVHAADEHGISILRSAVRNGDRHVIELLRAHGAHDDRIDPEDAARGDPMTLCIAAARDDLATLDRLLDAGASPNGAEGSRHMPPLHAAAWHGRLRAVQRLVERGADIHLRNPYGGDALASAIHGSANCFDTEGGPAMRLPEEAFAGDYPQILEYLIERGALLPKRVPEASDAVQELLRRHGVPDADI